MSRLEHLVLVLLGQMHPLLHRTALHIAFLELVGIPRVEADRTVWVLKLLLIEQLLLSLTAQEVGLVLSLL